MIQIIDSFSAGIQYTPILKGESNVTDSFSLALDYKPLVNDDNVFTDSFSMGVNLFNPHSGNDVVSNSFSLMYSDFELFGKLMPYKPLVAPKIHRVKKK